MTNLYRSAVPIPEILETAAKKRAERGELYALAYLLEALQHVRPATPVVTLCMDCRRYQGLAVDVGDADWRPTEAHENHGLCLRCDEKRAAAEIAGDAGRCACGIDAADCAETECRGREERV